MESFLYTMRCIKEWFICIFALVVLCFFSSTVGLVVFMIMRMYYRFKREKEYIKKEKKNIS